MYKTYKDINHKELLEELYYEPETGEFFWLVDGFGRTLGIPIGYKSMANYRSVTFHGAPIRMNRLAWFYMTGSWPEIDVGFKDGNTRNTRWDNLISVTTKERMDKFKEKLRDTTKNVEEPLQLKPVKKATFSNKEVHDAVEKFMSRAQLVNGRYITSD